MNYLKLQFKKKTFILAFSLILFLNLSAVWSVAHAQKSRSESDLYKKIKLI